jgi:hypothetical protein
MSVAASPFCRNFSTQIGVRAATTAVLARSSASLMAVPPVIQPKANLAVLQKISSNWEQGQYLEKGGWATRPGASSSDYQLARACAEKLVQIKIAAQ